MFKRLALATLLAFGCGPSSSEAGRVDFGALKGDQGPTVNCQHPPMDADGDGISDVDEDAGDGILDVSELTPDGSGVAATTRAGAPDTNKNGTPDYLDLDSDGDTILDKDEGIVDTDGDFTPNYRDLDSDGDCVPDAT